MSLHVGLIGEVLFSSFFVFFVARLLWSFIVKPLVSPLRKIPGLSFNPIWGNIAEATNPKYEAGEFSRKLLQKCGPICRFYFFFGAERVLVADPEVFRRVLVTHCHKYRRPGGFRLASKGLVSVAGKEHSAQRHLLGPLFTAERVANMGPVFRDSASLLRDYWRQQMPEEGSSVLHVQDDLQRMALDAVGRAIFSYHFDFLGEPNNTRAKAVSQVTGGLGLNNYLQFLPFYRYLPLPVRHREEQLYGVVKQLIEEVIAKKQEALSDTTEEHESMDLLDRLILARDKDGKGLEPKELRDQLVTFLFAGHETSSFTMTWALYMLSLHPEIQERARAEVNEMLTSGGENLYKEMDNLRYLHCVIMETLRLHPVVSNIARVTKEEDTLLGYRVPKNTYIVLHLQEMMRNPKIWSEPLRFNPDRFQEEIAPFTWMGFGAGPHVCIGKKFALLEVKVVLSELLRHFRFEAVPGLDVRSVQRLTVRPSPSLQLRVTPLAA